MIELWEKIAETSGARILGLLAGLVSLIITARLLGPDGRGTVAAILSWVSLFSTMAYLSLGQVAIYKAGQERGTEWFSQVFGALTVLTICLSFISLAVEFALYKNTGGVVYGKLPLGLLLIGSTMIPLQIWQQYSSSLLMAVDRLSVFNKAQVIGSTAGVCGIIVFVWILRWGVKGALVANILSQLLVALIGLNVLWQFAGRCLQVDLYSIRYLLTNGLKLHLNAVGTYLFTQSNILMLNYYVTKSEVGLYQLSYQLITIMLVVPQAASMVLYTIMAQKGADETWAANKRLLFQVTILMIILSGLAYIIAPWAIPLIAGSEFTPSVTLFRLLLPALIGMTFSTVMANQWIGRGLFLEASMLTLGCGFVNLGLNYYLIPRFGVRGAVYATIITAVCIQAMINLAIGVWCDRNVRRQEMA